MSRDARRPGTAGFALTEALVGALLLALALLGAGGSLVASLQAQRAALLQTRAADLAADLAEAARGHLSAGELALEVASWQSEVARTLPIATAGVRSMVGADGAIDHLNIELDWRESHSGRQASLRLPVAPAVQP